MHSTLAFAVLVAAVGLTPPQAPNSHRPIYSPDGQSLIFMSDRYDGDWELFRLPLAGGAAVRLTEHVGWDGYADVAPDGMSIVFDRSDDSERGVVLKNLQTGAEEWLLRASDDVFTGGARFAPDGSILYLSEVDGNREIYRMDLATRRSERITRTEQTETDAVPSPDGTLIAYVVWASETESALEIYDAHHDTVHRVLTRAGRMYGTAWSADGRSLIFNDDSDGDQEIYMTDLDGNDVRQLTNNTVPDHLASASPDGTTLVYTSERDNERVFVLDLGTGAERELGVQ